MGFPEGVEEVDVEECRSLLLDADDSPLPPPHPALLLPEDRFHVAYVVYLVLGAGFLLPGNTFITAIDYFSYMYPAMPVDRVFSISYMLSSLFAVLALVLANMPNHSVASLRVNAGLSLLLLSLLLVPLLDALYSRGRTGLYGAYDVTIAAVVLSGIANALVQGGVTGAAGELPHSYMQAVVAGTAVSGVLVSAMRILTKAIYPHDAHGLRKSANLYFAVSIAFMAICLVCYNVTERLPIIQYYREVKLQALKEERNRKSSSSGSTIWKIVGRIKWFGFGIFLIYLVTLSIFPGYITEDVHSEALEDWYPIVLIACYNVFDLVGKCLPAVHLLGKANVAVAASVTRLAFYPLFLGCLHGPQFSRTEIPVIVLTCLLGLSNGYFTTVLMILAPKALPIQYAETAGIVMVLFLVVGLGVGSVVSWFWVI